VRGGGLRLERAGPAAGDRGKWKWSCGQGAGMARVNTLAPF